MKKLNCISKYILIFVSLIIIYFLLLFIISLIPTNKIKSNVIDSSEKLLELGESPIYDLGYKKEQLFLFTDALMLNTAYSIDSNNPIESMLLARKSYVPGQTTIVHKEGKDVKSPKMYMIGTNTYQTKELYGLMHNDGNTEGFEYPRYWHGYLIILRPLLIFFNYSILRLLSFVVLMTLITLLIVLVWKKISLISMIIYLMGFISISIFLVAFSLNELLTFSIGIIASIILLLNDKKIDKYSGIIFFITGSVTSFMDLLTTPLVTLGLPLITYFLLKQREQQKFSENVKHFIKLSALWGISYALTWSMKWVMTDLILNRSIVNDSIKQIFFRTVGESKITFPSKLKSIYINVINQFGKIVIIVNIIISIIIGIIGIIKNKTKEINYMNILPYIVIFTLPIIWFVIINQHSIFHIFFSYRIYILAIIAFHLVIANIAGYYSNEYKKKELE